MGYPLSMCLKQGVNFPCEGVLCSHTKKEEHFTIRDGGSTTMSLHKILQNLQNNIYLL